MRTTLQSILCLAMIGSAIVTQAQTEDYPTSISIFAGPVDFIGEFDSHKTFDFGGDDTFFHFGAAVDLYANSSFDFGIGLATGEIGHNSSETGLMEGDFTALDLLMKYKLNNGYLLKEKAKIAPYLLAGGGLTDINGDSARINSNLLSNFAFGAGINIPLSEKISVDLRNMYKYTSSDIMDYRASGGNDFYMTLSAGLKMNLGKKADRDGDGISDKNDLCPDTPGLELLNGCPDSDGDGVADGADACPDVAGTAAMNGCPDTDGDGVADNLDTCPDKVGLAEFSGCPDTDGDGSPDNQDACPNRPGDISQKGCPDTDGDGVNDLFDQCLEVAGDPRLKGCPDQDMDGVIDSEDKCPETAGIAANKGCPEVSEETQEVFTQALQGIQFQSGRDVIKRSSYAILNNVAGIMQLNPAYKLLIQGHTDSQGDEDMNMELSEKRALAVKNYLIDNGIDENRMRSQGFGETQPVATNDSSAGRAKNRRVEFKVEF